MTGGQSSRRVLGVTLALLLAGCKPAAFERHGSDLMHEPPPILTEANGFWNDTANGSFGEVSFAAGLFRRNAQLCRPARQTIVYTATRATSDMALLYCQSPDGSWTWQRSIVCRANALAASAKGNGLVCRDPDGSDFTMAPA